MTALVFVERTSGLLIVFGCNARLLGFYGLCVFSMWTSSMAKPDSEGSLALLELVDFACALCLVCSYRAT